jgi:ABC-2 type transport system permease protein
MTRTWQLYRAEVTCQLLQQIRVPLQFFLVTFGTFLAYVTWVLVDYLFLRDLFTLPFDVNFWLIAFFSAQNTFNLGLMQMGYTTADERAQGWMRLRRASPMRPLLHFGAKLAVVLLQAVLSVLALLAVALFSGHLQLNLPQAATFFVVLTLGVLPFCALGLALAYLGGPGTARVVISYASLLLVALTFMLFINLDLGTFGNVLQAVNQLLPLYHFVVLAFGFVDLPALQTHPAWLHGLALLAQTALFTALAIFFYRYDEGKTYG